MSWHCLHLSETGNIVGHSSKKRPTSAALEVVTKSVDRGPAYPTMTARTVSQRLHQEGWRWCVEVSWVDDIVGIRRNTFVLLKPERSPL